MTTDAGATEDSDTANGEKSDQASVSVCADGSGTGAGAEASAGDKTTAGSAAGNPGQPGDTGAAAGGSAGQSGNPETAAGGGAGQSGDAADAASGGPGQGPAVPGGGGTDRREAIGRRLDETFGVFDEAVRNAQAAIAKERGEQKSGGHGEPGSGDESVDEEDSGAAGDGGRGPKSPGGLESVDRDGTDTGEGTGAANEEQTASTQGGVGGGGAAGGGGGPRSIPSDIPDGRDDDIVARQIREAAMQETDPELRAALWEEYRRYKRGR